jgi:hypothetical protein
VVWEGWHREVSPYPNVCPACSIAWGWKSSVQPDGGEGLAKHKGVITAMFEHARIAFDMARGVTLAQLAEQLATLGEIHGGLPLSIDVQVPVDRAH